VNRTISIKEISKQGASANRSGSVALGTNFSLPITILSLLSGCVAVEIFWEAGGLRCWDDRMFMISSPVELYGTY